MSQNKFRVIFDPPTSSKVGRDHMKDKSIPNMIPEKKCLSGISSRFGNPFKASQDFISQNFLHKLSAGERNQFGKKPAYEWGQMAFYGEANSEKKGFSKDWFHSYEDFRDTPLSLGNLGAFLGFSFCCPCVPAWWTRTFLSSPFSSPSPWPPCPRGDLASWNCLLTPAQGQARPALNQALTIHIWALFGFLQLGTSVQQPKSIP